MRTKRIFWNKKNHLLSGNKLAKYISNISNESKKTVQLKNLDKELVFITEGYFDFDEMIWKDYGRPIKSSQWYKNETYYVKFGFKFIKNLIVNESNRLGLINPSYLRFILYGPSHTPTKLTKTFRCHSNRYHIKTNNSFPILNDVIAFMKGSMRFYPTHFYSCVILKFL